MSARGRKASYAVIPGLRQAAKARLLNAIGTLSTADLGKIERAVAAYLAD